MNKETFEQIKEVIRAQVGVRQRKLQELREERCKIEGEIAGLNEAAHQIERQVK